MAQFTVTYRNKEGQQVVEKVKAWGKQHAMWQVEQKGGKVLHVTR